MQGARRRGGREKGGEREDERCSPQSHLTLQQVYTPMFLACVHHLVIVVVLHVVEEDLLVPGMEI